MDHAALGALVEVLAAGGEQVSVEAKAARRRLPHETAAAMSAFANTPGGGVLLLGVDEDAGFAVVGVADPQQAQHEIANLARDSLDPPLRPTVSVAEISGKPVVAVEVAELPRTEKPCYVRSKGINRGSFLRVANTTRRLTSEEVQQLVADRGQPRFDREVVADADVAELDPAIVDAYVARLRRRQPQVFESLDDSTLLETTHVLGRGPDGHQHPTLAGLLAMARFPQTHLPQLNITFVHYPTTDGVSDVEGVRFLDNVRLDGPIPLILRDCLAAITRNMSRRAVISGYGRLDVWEYPVEALRELIANALVHRDLSPGSRGSQVQVEMYPDRLRVSNPGGLFGGVDVTRLGEAGVAAARNADLLRILEDVVVIPENRTVCENRGSGIRAILRALSRAGMSAPVFTDRVTRFEVVLSDALASDSAARVPSEGERKDRSADLLALIGARGELSRTEIAGQLGITPKNASYWLAKLRKAGVIEPAHERQGRNVRYRLASSTDR